MRLTAHVRFGGGPSEKGQHTWHLASGLPDPKAHDKTKMRPLGIPVIMDRCHQARVRQALEPQWEARFEARSYGFRPGRGCHDAIGSLYNTLAGRAKRVWIVDADLAGAFNAISHDHVLGVISGFPGKALIAGWLKAGIVEAGKGFAPTTEGVPQGGVISPLILNIALHGLEEAAGVRYQGGRHACDVAPDSPAVTRYADDLVACCHTRQQAEQVKAEPSCRSRLTEPIRSARPARGALDGEAGRGSQRRTSRRLPVVGVIQPDDLGQHVRVAGVALGRGAVPIPIPGY